jgi:hypothetical protein
MNPSAVVALNGIRRSPESPNRQPTLTWRQEFSRWVCAVTLAGTSMVCSAAPWTLSIQDPDRIGAPGATLDFWGTITNASGVDFNASDLFLNFAGFDPSVVTLTQVLGAPDLSIPAGTTSGPIDLFQFTLDAAAPGPATYFSDVTLEDPNNNVSDVVTVSVRVPEPSTWTMVAAALLAGWVARRRPGSGRPSRQAARESDVTREG